MRELENVVQRAVVLCSDQHIEAHHLMFDDAADLALHIGQETLTQTAGADGTYTFADVSGLTAPLMLQATGTAGGTNYTLHSVLETAPASGVSGIINVSPQTDAATAQALGAEPATVFADAAQIKTIDATKLADAKARLNAALADVLFGES